MNMLITQLIHASNGYCYEAAGMISAFFDHPGQARDCAGKLAKLVEGRVEVCGCQIAVWL